ncbi:MAG: hypothetical protein ACI30A_06750 [Paludibacteraceae bacterium]
MAKVTTVISVGISFTYDEKRISHEDALSTATRMVIQPSEGIEESVQVFNVYTQDQYGNIHYHN